MAKNDEEEYEDGPTEITSEDPSEENHSESMTDDGFSTEAISQASDDDSEDDDDDGNGGSNSSKKVKKSNNIVYLGIGGVVIVGVSIMALIFLSGSDSPTAPNTNPEPVVQQQQNSQMNGDFSSSGMGNQEAVNSNNDPFANTNQSLPETSQNQNQNMNGNGDVAFPDMTGPENGSENSSGSTEEAAVNSNVQEQDQQSQSGIRTAEDFQAQLDSLNQSQAETSTQEQTNNEQDVQQENITPDIDQSNNQSSNQGDNNASEQVNNYDLDESDNEGLDLVDASAFRELKNKVGSLEKKFNAFQKHFKNEMTTVINRLDNNDKAINKLESSNKTNSSSKKVSRPVESANSSSSRSVGGNMVQVIRDEPKYNKHAPETASNEEKVEGKVEKNRSNQPEMATEKKALDNYQIQAIIPGRVWLKTSGSGAMSYTVGDLVDSSRRISSIDAKSAKVILSDGTVVE